MDGSSITAVGTGVAVIHPPGGSQLLALWPSYYYRTAPQHNFPPNPIKHNLQILSVQTEYAYHLQITVSSAIQLKFPSLPVELQSTGLDFFRAEIVLPPMDLSMPTAVTLRPWRIPSPPSLQEP
jgi:hypothetical protein